MTSLDIAIVIVFIIFGVFIILFCLDISYLDILDSINEKQIKTAIRKKQYYKIAKNFCDVKHGFRLDIFSELKRMDLESQPFVVAIINYLNVNFKPEEIEDLAGWSGVYNSIVTYKEKYEADILCNKEPVSFIQYYWVYYCNGWDSYDSKYKEKARAGESYFETCMLHRYDTALKDVIKDVPTLKPILRSELEWFLNQLSKKRKEWILDDKEYFKLTKKLLVEYEIVEEGDAEDYLTKFLSGKIDMIGSHKAGPREC